jgi:hypothetical protein
MTLLNNFAKHKFLDSWVNLKSNISNRLWYKKYNGDSGVLTPPSEYSSVFIDEFKTALNLQEWRYGMPWGDFHPTSPHQYYDNDGTLSYVSKEGLVLELKKIPKIYKKSDLPDWRQPLKMDDEFTIPVGVGLVTTKQSWKYGWFEATIKLPKGMSYWPALWLSGLETWPPEIDIFEGYSHESPLYNHKNTPHRNIQPNLHYGVVEDGTKKMYGSFNNTIHGATDRFVQYVCHWEKDFIKIYYDGRLVFQCTEPKILEWFNKPNSHQYLIINHGLHEHHTDNPDESAMIIKSVKIYQKNK